MNSVKDKRSGEKSGQSLVKKGHSSKRFLKYHVERNYFKGMNRNASNYQESEFISTPFSHSTEIIEMEDIVGNIVAEIGSGATVVEEVSNNLLSYKTPKFSADAMFDIPSLLEGTDIQIGWIQVCTENISTVFHGDKTVFSWELPELVSGKYSMFSDSNIYSMPWYNVENGVTTNCGPSSPSTAFILMDDIPSALTTWCDPSAGLDASPSLTYIYRKQNFLTYLVIKNMKENTYEIIKCISWNCKVAIEMNPQNKLGERVVFVAPCESQKPKFLSKENTPPLEENIFQPFVANECMLLVKRSKNQRSCIKKKPRDSTLNLEKYLDDTYLFSADLFKVTKRNFLLDYKRKTE